MAEIQEYLPLIIPLIIVQFGLLLYTIYHIMTHKTYKKGTRTIWLIVVIVGMQFIGPILYFLLGRESE
ncbi:MAG: hypothetical protein GXY06_00110 [Clostridiaceae bacterium]|nr:hypothetical protein [Clostridiaceae bacterium]